jgi:ribosome maturation factor RimP
LKGAKQIEDAVFHLCQPAARSAGLEVVQVQYRRETLGWVLRVLIDRPGGVTVDDCTSFSRELSDLLDVEELISSRFHLEVSSPGLDRPLTCLSDFIRFAGNQITLRSAQPVDGRSNFKGKLLGVENDHVIIEVDGKKVSILWSGVEKANLVPVFEGSPCNPI